MTAIATSSKAVLRAGSGSSVGSASATGLTHYTIARPAHVRQAQHLCAAPSSQRRFISKHGLTRSVLDSSIPRHNLPVPPGGLVLQSPHFHSLFRFYATSAYAQATPNSAQLSPQASKARQEKDAEHDTKHESDRNAEEEQPDPDEPPKKASIRERLRFLTRRYGWWALGVYLLASTVDFSLVFVAIHMLGADHIRNLEDQLRDKVGLGKRKMDDEEVAAWPVPIITPVEGTAQQIAQGGVVNNQTAAREALAKRGNAVEAIGGTSKQEQPASLPPSSGQKNASSTLWTEAVLAYTIHKTLLLPFRVGVTAAVTPSFVKYMVRMGWARDNAAVQQAAARARTARKASKASR